MDDPKHNDTTTVYVARGWSSDDKVYHINRECPAANKSHNLTETTEQDAADVRGFRECRQCTRDYDSSDYDNSYQKALKQAAKSD